PGGRATRRSRPPPPQLEPNRPGRGREGAEPRRKLEPMEREVRKRIGNFILAEDDQTLEGVILRELERQRAPLSVVETFTSGHIVGRLAHLPSADGIFRRGVTARSLPEVWAAVGLTSPPPTGGVTPADAEAVARAARAQTGTSHALAVLIDLDDG